MAGRFGKAIAHHALAESCDKRSKHSGLYDEITASILAECEPHHHTLVISSEQFQTLASTRRVARFLKNFKGAHVDIICYFREYADYMVSSFRQATQNQLRFRTFSDFLTHKYNLKSFFRSWQKLGSFQVKWYSRDLLKDGDIVQDFCVFTGLPLLKLWNETRNVSMGGNILFLKLAANKFGREVFTYKELSALAEDFPRFRKLFYVSKERIDIARTANNYNRFLEKRMGGVPKLYWDEYESLPDMKMMDEDVGLIEAKFPHITLSPLLPFAGQAKTWF